MKVSVIRNELLFVH